MQNTQTQMTGNYQWVLVSQGNVIKSPILEDLENRDVEAINALLDGTEHHERVRMPEDKPTHTQITISYLDASYWLMVSNLGDALTGLAEIKMDEENS